MHVGRVSPLSEMFSSFAVPETRAGDCEPGASSSAASARRNLSDHWSQLRFIGEAVWHVDRIVWVNDGNNAADLWLSACKDTGHTRSHTHRQTNHATTKSSDVSSSISSYLLIKCDHFLPCDKADSIPRKHSLSPLGNSVGVLNQLLTTIDVIISIFFVPKNTYSTLKGKIN